MDLRKHVLESGMSQIDVAKELGTSPQGLRQLLMNKNPKIDTIIEVGKVIGKEPHEMIPISDGYDHLYDNEGKWIGIVTD